MSYDLIGSLLSGFTFASGRNTKAAHTRMCVDMHGLPLVSRAYWISHKSLATMSLCSPQVSFSSRKRFQLNWHQIVFHYFMPKKAVGVDVYLGLSIELPN